MYDLLTEIVAAVPVNVGALFVPAGVYVASPEEAALTVAVLFAVVAVVVVTLPVAVTVCV